MEWLGLRTSGVDELLYEQAALTGFDASCAASDQRATDALLVCVPILVTALTKFYQFHATQQARAKKETGDLERKLDTHLEYFGDSAPTTTEDLQKRIREFVGVISRSTQTLLQLADAQSRLWETRKASLPPPVRQVVVREYGRLWRQLSGQFHDVRWGLCGGGATERKSPAAHVGSCTVRR